jgi:hypothetical protein
MKLIDADKLLEWGKVALGSANLWDELKAEIESGRVDPTPPVQPDINPGVTKVRHKDHANYGIGNVIEIAKSGLRAHCNFPDYDKRVSHWEPRGYYRLDKLEVITDGS